MKLLPLYRVSKIAIPVFGVLTFFSRWFAIGLILSVVTFIYVFAALIKKLEPHVHRMDTVIAHPDGSFTMRCRDCPKEIEYDSKDGTYTTGPKEIEKHEHRDTKPW